MNSHSEQVSSSEFETKKKKLTKALSHSFRKGTSAFRLGLIQVGPSDHLPYSAHIESVTGETLKIAGWNLLADCHLYNNFMNITGTQQLIVELSQLHPKGNLYLSEDANRLFYFFSELAQFLYVHITENKLHISAELLREFISLAAQSSNLALSRDPDTAKTKRLQVESARREIVEIFIKGMNLSTSSFNLKPNNYGHELRLALHHALELIHHIQHADGVLRWTNRLKLIQNNRELIQTLSKHDFICLQECTNPEDIKHLLHASLTQFKSIVYKISERTVDHCVMLYDKANFELMGEPVNYALEGKKPCIFAKFKNLATNSLMIVGSIHHPGGQHNLTAELLAQVDLLRKGHDSVIPYFIAGDFNHDQNFFSQKTLPQHAKLIFPEEGTMAGSDYDNINKPIDALMTDVRDTSVKLKLIDQLEFSAPAPTLPFEIIFKSIEQVALPGFFQRVERGIMQASAQVEESYRDAAKLLGVADTKRGGAIKL